MLIGLAGFAGSGKDTAAQALVAAGWTRVAFADKLKELAQQVNPYIVDNGNVYRLSELITLGGWDGAKTYVEVRRLLQNLGVAVRDIIGEDTWINAALQRYGWGERFPFNENWIVTDVRFTNELDRIHTLGGKVYWMRRPRTVAVNGHISEHEINAGKCDGVIENTGDIAALHRLMRQVAGIPMCDRKHPSFGKYVVLGNDGEQHDLRTVITCNACGETIFEQGSPTKNQGSINTPTKERA